MALMSCPECSREVSSAAVSCPQCGHPILQQMDVSPRSSTAEWNPGIAAVLSLLIPGAGQIYRGEIGSGLIWLVCTVIGYMLFVIPGLFLHAGCIFDAARKERVRAGA